MYFHYCSLNDVELLSRDLDGKFTVKDDTTIVCDVNVILIKAYYTHDLGRYFKHNPSVTKIVLQ